MTCFGRFWRINFKAQWTYGRDTSDYSDTMRWISRAENCDKFTTYHFIFTIFNAFFHCSLCQFLTIYIYWLLNCRKMSLLAYHDVIRYDMLTCTWKLSGKQNCLPHRKKLKVNEKELKPKPLSKTNPRQSSKIHKNRRRQLPLLASYWLCLQWYPWLLIIYNIILQNVNNSSSL